MPPVAPGEGGHGPAPKVLPLTGQVTTERASGFTDEESVDVVRYAQVKCALEAIGEPDADPALFLEAVRLFNQAPPPADPGPSDTPRQPTPKERRDALSAEIEHKTREIDARQGWEFGTTNGLIVERFGKSRLDMAEPELLDVWRWISELSDDLDARAEH
jgi:hypothetical protein